MRFYRLLVLSVIVIVLTVTVLLFICGPFTSISLLEQYVANSVMKPDTISSMANSTQATDVTFTENFDNLFIDLQPVDENYVLNSINWSRYPGIEPIRVHDNEISGPTYVINHSFLYFTVDVAVKDPENTSELFREMAGVVIEIRQIVGHNSSISVVGIVNGLYSYSVGKLPYDEQVYAIDHYHPYAFKNDIYLIPGDDIYDYHNYILINNSVIEP